MANFNTAFMVVMRNEDPDLSGVVTPEPHGGKARFGINSLAHPEAVREGFYEMTNTEAWIYAEDIFKYDYWSKVWGYDIKDQNIANKFVDLAFNLAAAPATKIIQRAINSLHTVLVLTVDGQVGPLTMTALNFENPELLMAAIKIYGTQYYKDILAAHPEFQKYYHGWIVRLMGLVERGVTAPHLHTLLPER